jgi:hypothetical protein
VDREGVGHARRLRRPPGGHREEGRALTVRRGGAALVVVVSIAAVSACRRHGDGPPVQTQPRLLAPPDPATLPAPGTSTSSAAAEGYLGPEACEECHAERVETVRRTSHWSSSAKVTRDGLQAKIEPGAGVHPGGGLSVEVSERAGELWQDATDELRHERMSRRMDVVIGSGKLAQTFLTWEKDRLYELPMTWFAQVGWRASPGYLQDRVDFSRPVVGQCLECHALWAQPGHPELVHDNAFVGEVQWGITCEKCHGPGREHVAWARQNPRAEHGKFVVVPSDLAPEHKDDVCLLCHSSRGDDVKPVFSFRPGDDLRAHYAAPPAKVALANDSLHAFDQGDRLHESRCWKEAKDMTCITCHNPHRSERGNDDAFTARCLGCHDGAKLSRKAGESKHDGKTACVDCHMPRRGTDAEKLPDGTTEPRAPMRDHRIAVY